MKLGIESRSPDFMNEWKPINFHISLYRNGFSSRTVHKTPY